MRRRHLGARSRTDGHRRLRMDVGRMSHRSGASSILASGSRRLACLLASLLWVSASGAAATEPTVDDLPPRRMFITSVSGTGNFSTWPDAGGSTGVAAADAICQARAGIAGLPNAEAFRAWISDTEDDAYCRLHGRGGSKADSCGESTLPVAAGPWIRVDGLPFAPSIDSLLSPANEVFHPPRIDEFGAERTDSVWTGTTGAGVLSATGDCFAWASDTSGFAAVGSSDGTSEAWTSTWASPTRSMCSSSHALLCFEAGVGGALPALEARGVLAFVSSAVGSANLSTWAQAGGASGIAAGDAICQALAGSAGLADPTRFKAWLSDSTLDAKSRFASGGPWVRLDRTSIAISLAELTSAVLGTSISQTELGEYVGNAHVWTGTNADGTQRGSGCSGWTSTSSSLEAVTGTPNVASSSWTRNTQLIVPARCNVTARLYCLAAPIPIFSDDFETGDTSMWTLVVGIP